MRFRELLSANTAYLAPAVFNPLSAKLADQAGFKMLYLGGGALGYVKCCLEANLNLTEVVQAGIEIRGVSALPLILDAACGFGDPMHMHHTIGLAEAAGFCAIEIEDQLIPKRAHHHIGIEHMIPCELMVAKVREAVRARRNPEFVIIARTNAVRQTGMDDAVARGLAYREAGADMLYITPRNPDEARQIAKKLPPPFMFSFEGGENAGAGLTQKELGELGYRVLTVATTALPFHRAMKQTYEAIARGVPNPIMAGTTRKAEQAALHQTLGFDALIAIEKATVEK
ncbi:MAG: isocitrate lyase/PEP mutase family protein [Betaproteobacteria bacterium]|nr:isocitrate lyase/PEP mutase family protein [Betaproteobacteria bacterium]